MRIAEKMLRFPLLGDEVDGKWKIQLGREFHMTDDKDLFHLKGERDMLPLYEGKMIWHFTAHYAEPRYWIRETEGRAAVIGLRTKDTGQILDYQCYRFGCRSITGNTNERTMVCSILPKNVFCGNSLAVTKFAESTLSNEELLYLTTVMSGFIVDFSLRQRVATQLNMFYIYQTSVPRLTAGDRFFDAIVERAARLVCTTPEFDDLAKEVGLGSHRNGITDAVGRARLRAELDGMVAHLYNLTEVEFAHILSTFPLVPEPVKIAARNAWRDVERGLIR